LKRVRRLARGFEPARLDQLEDQLHTNVRWRRRHRSIARGSGQRLDREPGRTCPLTAPEQSAYRERADALVGVRFSGGKLLLAQLIGIRCDELQKEVVEPSCMGFAHELERDFRA